MVVVRMPAYQASIQTWNTHKPVFTVKSLVRPYFKFHESEPKRTLIPPASSQHKSRVLEEDEEREPKLT